MIIRNCTTTKTLKSSSLINRGYAVPPDKDDGMESTLKECSISGDGRPRQGRCYSVTWHLGVLATLVPSVTRTETQPGHGGGISADNHINNL